MLKNIKFNLTIFCRNIFFSTVYGMACRSLGHVCILNVEMCFSNHPQWMISFRCEAYFAFILPMSFLLCVFPCIIFFCRCVLAF